MKKILTLSTLTLTCALATAQSAGDALSLSENNYYGTARSIAMGNAFTALGGDLGSIGLNPAGSAVNKYSQITISPGLNLAITKADYNATPSTSNGIEKFSTTQGRAILPNIGITANFNTGNKTGLKNFSIGFIGTATSFFNNKAHFGGINNQTSYAGELANYATLNGFSSTALDNADYYNSNFPWEVISGYQSGVISGYGDKDDQFVGTTESIYDNGDIATSGPLKQRYDRKRTGYKYDMILNFGLNFSDKLYVGLNLGVTSIHSEFKSVYREAAQNPADFAIEFADGNTASFMDFRYRQALKTTGAGIYGKVGVIFVPSDHIRIGAAIQTPTVNYLTERFRLGHDCNFSDNAYSAGSLSPENKFSYRLISPYRVNLGVAYTFGGGLISADYQMCDYSTMRYKDSDEWGSDVYDDINDNISAIMDIAHTLRLGAEFKLNPEVAIRAGYNFSTNPEKAASKAYTHAVSCGVGYNSRGSFFCDLALRGKFLPTEWFYPYGNYIDGVASPETKLKTRLWDAVLTFGWRF